MHTLIVTLKKILSLSVTSPSILCQVDLHIAKLYKCRYVYKYMCISICAERERERESVCVCVCIQYCHSWNFNTLVAMTIKGISSVNQIPQGKK